VIVYLFILVYIFNNGMHQPKIEITDVSGQPVGLIFKGQTI
jgi:hypothetical protein